MKRAQTATEFVILVSFMLIVFFIFFVILQERIIDVTKQQDLLYLQEANNLVLAEAQLAFESPKDFQHDFTIPDVDGTVFNVDILDNREVRSEFGGVEYVNFFPYDVVGELNPVTQVNTVYGLDGSVQLPGNIIYYDAAYTGVFVNVNPELCYYADDQGECANTDLLPAAMRPRCQAFFALC